MHCILQTMFAVIAAVLTSCYSDELNIDDHPAFKVDDLPTPFSTLRVAAFNIQVFGVTKMSKADVVDCLKKVTVFSMHNE
jgi:hypothetical protein